MNNKNLPINKRSNSNRPSSVFNLQRMISQNKAGKNLTIDIQILVLIDNLNQRFAMIPESPKQNWMIWDNVIQCLDALDTYLYPKVVAGPQDWRDRYKVIHEAFENAHILIHTNPYLLKKMCYSRMTFYNMILASLNYADPYEEALDERSEMTEIDDEESVTIYGD